MRMRYAGEKFDIDATADELRKLENAARGPAAKWLTVRLSNGRSGRFLLGPQIPVALTDLPEDVLAELERPLAPGKVTARG